MARAVSLLSVGLAIAFTVVVVSAPAEASSSAAGANDCVSIKSAELSSGLAFDVENGCDKRLSCALTWTLTCQNASGKATSKAKQEARFVIGASDTHHTAGSASICKDSWKIDEVAWDCAPAQK
jgi:hypothetical protein